MAGKLTHVFFNIYPFILATDSADAVNACVLIKSELQILCGSHQANFES
jgi:hypothetical protein